MDSVMRKIRIEKLTLNVGAGKDQTRLEKGIKLLKSISGFSPVKTFSKKRIAAWGIRPGLPIGCKLTLRGEKARALLKRLLQAKENTLKPEQFDANGNVAFGIHEYIDIPDAQYDPDIGIMGFEVCITLERPGYRIKRRHVAKKPIPQRHRISRDEAMAYLNSAFEVAIDGGLR